MNRYTFRAEFCPQSGEYRGLCLELPFLKCWGPTAPEAVALVSEAVDEHLAMLREAGQQAPAPLTERSYSGTFVVRTSTALHARLALEATEQRVSMNQWIVQQLSGRKPKDIWESILFD